MTTGRDLFIPETITDTQDPTKLGAEEGGSGHKYWDEKGKEARSKREFEEEQRQARLANEREANPPESPFQVTGRVNLGDFDMQKNAEELRNTISSIQTESRAREDKLTSSNADYRDKIAEIRSQMIEATLKAQIDNLTKTIQQTQNPNSNVAITDRISEITSIAQMLGYSKPGPAAQEAGLPANIQLQMLAMEMTEKGRSRQFEWDKIESERNWQIALKKLELEAQGKNAEIQLQKDKRASLVNPLESIGAALARGFADMGGGKGGGGGGEETSPKIRKAPKGGGGGKTFNMQASMSDSGTISCPECQEPMAIAPKAKSAFCPSCEAIIQIDRTADAAPPDRGLI